VSGAVLRRANEITPKRVEWLMRPQIPFGKLTAIAGQMGQAKSVLTVYLAAAVTTADGVNLDAPANVLMCSAEDDPEDTTVPRLIGAGANLERIAFPGGNTLDADELSSHCDELGDVALISIDPVSAFFAGKTDSWKSQDVRRALEPIRLLAQERQLAVILIQHLNRRSDTNDALARIADSQGIPALARSVLIWGASPDDPEGDQGTLKVLTRAKSNLARASSSLLFRIDETTIPGGITVPRLVLVGESDVRAEDITADPETRTRTDEAIRFLEEILASGSMPAEDIKTAADEADITPKCLRIARERVCSSFRPEGNHGPYHWKLRRQNLGHSGAIRGIQEPWMSVDAQDALIAHANLKQRIRDIGKLPENQSDAAWQALEAEMAGA
jgi:hypothetical protein